MRQRRQQASPFRWVYVPLGETSFGDFIPSDENGGIALGPQIFGRFEAISDYRFAECFVANRTLDLIQRIRCEIDGELQEWHFDQRQNCGWRTLGIEPILEITNEISGLKRWYVYRLHSTMNWHWCEIVPMRGQREGFQTSWQLARCGHLVIQSVITAVAYWLTSFPFLTVMAAATSAQ